MVIGCPFSVATLAVAIRFLCSWADLDGGEVFGIEVFYPVPDTLNCGCSPGAFHLPSVMRLFFSFNRLMFVFLGHRW